MIKPINVSLGLLGICCFFDLSGVLFCTLFSEVLIIQEVDVMNITDLSKEYKNVQYGWHRAAFGSIVRRYYSELKEMNTDEKRNFIKT